METLSKTPAVDAVQNKFPQEWSPALPTDVMSGSLSLSSYKEYPAQQLFINRLKRHKAQACIYNTPQLSSPGKSIPESNSAEILSALRNLQEKIRRLELDKSRAECGLHTTGKDASTTQRLAERLAIERERGETSGHPYCNQVLITQLAAAESRCQQLERQLDHMRRMVHHAKVDRTSLLKQQVSMAAARSDEEALDSVSEHAQLGKIERLEQEYTRLTLTQNKAERKICELEMKLQEEEHQRKLVQDKANLLQTGLEANRILLQSVSPRSPRKLSKEKTPTSKRSCKEKPKQQTPSYTQPHYRLSLGDVPFVAGTSVGCSHSVRANVQSVLSLLKQHQPQLCNSRVLSRSRRTTARPAHGRRSDHSTSSSSSSSASEEELSELVLTLQEELQLMSLEQTELMRRVEGGVSEHERKELQREQEKLLMKMERKGEQISKLYKHKQQMKKLRNVSSGKPKQRNGEVSALTTVATRSRTAGAVRLEAGERIKRNLILLKDMKALQTSLRT